MASHDTHAHAAHHDHDANAIKVYGGVLAALLLLTVVTVAASLVQFGSGFINVVVALSIATVKASLVALYFMHLRHDKPINSIILVGSFIFLGLLLISCYTDFATRDNPIPSNLKIQAPVPGSPAPPPAPPAAH